MHIDYSASEYRNRCWVQELSMDNKTCSYSNLAHIVEHLGCNHLQISYSVVSYYQLVNLGIPLRSYLTPLKRVIPFTNFPLHSSSKDAHLATITPMCLLKVKDNNGQAIVQKRRRTAFSVASHVKEMSQSNYAV